jgi:hypothetical protein
MADLAVASPPLLREGLVGETLRLRGVLPNVLAVRRKYKDRAGTNV